MNLKLKRLVRTNSSEQYALFDLDQIDAEDQLPITIGKLDLHYTGEGVYGTLLLWDDASRQLHNDQRQEFIHALLDEVSQPMGVPNEFVVEFFAPTLDEYEVFHNVGLDIEELDSEELDLEEDEEYRDTSYDDAGDEGAEYAAGIDPEDETVPDVSP